MNNHKGLTIWTLAAQFFIILAAGHGIGTIGLLQLVITAEAFGLGNFFSSEPLFKHPLFWVVVITFLGQSLVLVSLFKKQFNSIKIAGLGFLQMAFLILLNYLREQKTIVVTIVTGLPFLILSFLLTYKLIYKREVILET